MEYFPAPLEKLTEQFARLPGIGGKTAQRLAFYVLRLPQEEAQEFADAIGTAPSSAWWRTPGTWRPWSAPGSTTATTTCSTAY